MSKYLDKSSLTELNEYRKKIFALREEAYRKFEIDVLDNDTLSALSMHEVIEHYDSDYNINFSRNGEDGKSNGVLIEQKATKVKKYKKSGLYKNGAFMFHARGNIEYDRYIFGTRDEVTLDIIRIYDISDPANVLLVQNHLLAQRAAWEAKNKKLGYTQKRDAITLPEVLLINNLVNNTQQIINNCEVVRA